jgi:protein-S-isoprenylcysteine O-methyltransferase Ste14
MRIREKIGPQKLIVVPSGIILASIFIIPGLDKRFNWSDVSLAIVLVADTVILLGYALSFFVLKENSYASRIIEVEESQKVISTGPYAIIRHPMYVAVLLIYVFIPLSLGSYWAMLAIIPLLILLIFRIINEEKLLMKELKRLSSFKYFSSYNLNAVFIISATLKISISKYFC